MYYYRKITRKNIMIKNRRNVTLCFGQLYLVILSHDRTSPLHDITKEDITVNR